MKSLILIVLAGMLFVVKSQGPHTFGLADAIFFLAFGVAVLVGFYMVHLHQKGNDDKLH